MALRIITFNSWAHYGPYKARQRAFICECESLKADIICLQETSDKAIVDQLYQLGFIYSTQAADEQLSICSKIKLDSSAFHAYQAQSTSTSIPRGIIVASFHINDKPLLIANTHLSWQPDEAKLRLRQVKELLNNLKSHHYPSIVTGDFNCTSDTKAIKMLTTGDYIDSFAQRCPLEAGITWDNQNPFIQTHTSQFPDRRIDYIFVQKNIVGLELVSAKVVLNQPGPDDIFPSDHYGVMATFE